MIARHVDECDVIVCPDNDLLMFLIFFSYWKCKASFSLDFSPTNYLLTSPPLLFPNRYTAKPLLSSTHTNFKVLFEGSGPVGKYVAAPLIDPFFMLFSQLATETWTTSPSYKDVLTERGYQIKGVFSPRIKLSVFEKTDSAEEVAAAREWLTAGVKCDYVMISAGRWSREKRINLLTGAIPENCCLAIFGDGPGVEAEAVMALHDPKKRIIVHRGMVNQDRLRVLYKACDFLLSASEFETLGMTVAEAHLCGTPVIVQNAAGFTTQVVQGQNGFLVDFASADILETVKHCVANKPTKAMIADTVSKRWDYNLPNLEEVVENLATKNKPSEWNNLGSKIPLFLWGVFIVCYYLLYRTLSFPFVHDKRKREHAVSNPGDKHKGCKLI